MFRARVIGGLYMFEQYPEVATVNEVAEMLRIGRNTAYELVRSGAVQGVKAGRSLRITKSAVIDYLTRKPSSLELSAIALSRKKR